MEESAREPKNVITESHALHFGRKNWETRQKSINRKMLYIFLFVPRRATFKRLRGRQSSLLTVVGRLKQFVVLVMKTFVFLEQELKVFQSSSFSARLETTLPTRKENRQKNLWKCMALSFGMSRSYTTSIKALFSRLNLLHFLPAVSAACVKFLTHGS